MGMDFQVQTLNLHKNLSLVELMPIEVAPVELVQLVGELYAV